MRKTFIFSFAACICAAAMLVAGDRDAGGRAAAPTSSQIAATTRALVLDGGRVKSAALGISFECPQGFVAGLCQTPKEDTTGFFADSIAVLEQSIAQKNHVDLHAVVTGDFPGISILRTKGIRNMAGPTTKKIINGNRVYR